MCQGLIQAIILYSKERETQGDLLDMVLYGLGLLLLIHALARRMPGTWQFWYADDAGLGVKLTVIGEFWTHLCEIVPRFRYYPEPIKSILVAHGGAKETAASHFEVQPFRVVAGCRYQGGFQGDEEGGVPG